MHKQITIVGCFCFVIFHNYKSLLIIVSLHIDPADIWMANTQCLGGNSSIIFLSLKSRAGRLVGGLDVLTKMENVPTDRHDRPMVGIGFVFNTTYTYHTT